MYSEAEAKVLYLRLRALASVCAVVWARLVKLVCASQLLHLEEQ